jgi:hypothetical protein
MQPSRSWVKHRAVRNGLQGRSCACRQCERLVSGMSAVGQKPTFGRSRLMSASCHVWGSRLASQNFTWQHWSVQSFVRPVDAVTAGQMSSAVRIPVISPHCVMHGHEWVVPIAGSTGAALRAVRPPNRHITPMTGAGTFTPQARGFSLCARPWPSRPRPFW